MNVPRQVYTVLVATLGGLLVGLSLRSLGVRHGESLQKETEAGRVPYRGVPGLVVTALIGLISGASLGPEGPLGGAFMSIVFTDSLSYPIYANLIAATVVALIGAQVVFNFTAILPDMALPFPPYECFLWLHLLYAVIFGLVGLGIAFLFKVIFQTVTRMINPLPFGPVSIV